MMISTKGRYALRVMIDLAESGLEEYVPLKEIADREGISRKYLENIMTVLSKAGLVDAIHGKGGGYRLNRRPEEYTLAEILNLTEGTLAPVSCRRLGYAPFVLTDRLSCEAREAGRFLSAAAQYHAGRGRALALLAGGETVVHVTGSGLGGRNQELALAAAPGLEGLSDAAVFSFGSDGTDGPTDAAGGYADGRTAAILRALGRTAEAWLDDNDAWHALAQTGGLLRTGPTGTNVNDLSVLLIGKPRLTF